MPGKNYMPGKTVQRYIPSKNYETRKKAKTKKVVRGKSEPGSCLTWSISFCRAR